MTRWNDRQQEVLDSLKDGILDPQNILVSAAAGSGKTAVLVERIIQTVSEGLADIDEILVVTFTNDAAAQMRSKILSALEKLAANETNDPARSTRYLRQLSLAENADIMTIDSFCNKVVRENFNIAGIDPAFEIYDTNEIALLKDEVLDEVLGRHYQDDKVMAGLTSFLFKKNIDDGTVKDIILAIHRVADTFADKDAWLEAARENTTEENREVINEKWVKDYKDYLTQTAEATLQILDRQIQELGRDTDPDRAKGNDKLREIYENDREIITAIRNSETLSGKAAAFKSSWSQLRRSKAFDAFSDEELDQVRKLRKTLKDNFTGIVSENDIVSEALSQNVINNCLIDIVVDFDETLMKEKKRQKKYEFSDIAHAAFNILYDVKSKAATKIGLAKANEYKYIYIDEYQDSSDLQEELLSAVARRDSLGRPNNIFMVGDVKQSIYRFRMARPELFIEKAGRYQEKDGGRLISLNMNYRSRSEVLEGTNLVFKSVMTPDFGGVLYDELTRLNTPEPDDYKQHYPDTDLNVGGIVQLERISGWGNAGDAADDDEEDDDLSDGLEYSKEEVEAIEIGRTILSLVDSFYVLNESFIPDMPETEDNARYRKARFGDIVILQRSIRGHMDMVRIYEQMGIPVSIEDSGAYFEELEISTLISVLRIIDNVQQDIPYASVLLSHIGGLTDEELVWVVGKSSMPQASLADKCNSFVETFKDSSNSKLSAVAEKLDMVRRLRDRWARLRPFLSTHDLLNQVLLDTGYETFVAAMPDGRRRIENIKKLLFHAESFESVRNAGLLDFLKYIDKCMSMEKNLDDSTGGADGGGDKGVVRITSIHKSKGLEYPIVFVALMGKGFRLSEKKGDVAVYPDYHLVVNRMKLAGGKVKVKRKSVKEAVTKLLTEREIKTEEARLLYVAMTRAKEKLYLVGVSDGEAPLMLGECKSYIDYVNYALSKEMAGLSENKLSELPLIAEDKTASDIISDFRKIYKKKELDYTESLNILMDSVRDNLTDIRAGDEKADNPYDYIYPYRYFTSKKSKLSVSEIKHAEMKESTEIQDDSDLIVTECLDDIEKETARVRAARRGTVIHAIFERLDYSRVASKESLGIEIERVLGDSFFSDEDRELVSIRSLLSFYSDEGDSLFQRMREAFKKDVLRREQQFIAGLPMEELPGTAEEIRSLGADVISEASDFVVIQGIMDAFFYEGDEIILVDYKTDNIKTGQELLDRYAAQMYLYALTLEKLTGKTVADCILYSTRLGEVHYPDWRNYI
ncbi:DNA helicase/exodeoxyribonuclease V, subunit A [Lachnospiraceae bacterium NE2001]|nr:DNA helicase/exodeoxyribonuclease V, subunit A [Lachnospiraceae bacterium NE2001]